MPACAARYDEPSWRRRSVSAALDVRARSRPRDDGTSIRDRIGRGRRRPLVDESTTPTARRAPVTGPRDPVSLSRPRRSAVTTPVSGSVLASASTSASSAAEPASSAIVGRHGRVREAWRARGDARLGKRRQPALAPAPLERRRTEPRRTDHERRGMAITWPAVARADPPITAGRASGRQCYTPALTARTERSSAGTAPERARDGASRAGTTA